MEPFNSYDDQVRYINRTICMYKGKPVYVHAGTEKTNEVKVEELDTRKFHHIKVQDEAFSTFPFELGFMNHQGTCVFLSRQGSRISYYGLSPSRIGYDYLMGDNDHRSLNIPFNIGFLQCLNNIYPSLNEAISSVKDGTNKSCAFHKHYAIGLIEDEVLGLFSAASTKPFACLGDDDVFVPYLNLKKSRALLHLAKKSGVI